MQRRPESTDPRTRRERSKHGSGAARRAPGRLWAALAAGTLLAIVLTLGWLASRNPSNEGARDPARSDSGATSWLARVQRLIGLDAEPERTSASTAERDERSVTSALRGSREGTSGPAPPSERVSSAGAAALAAGAPPGATDGELAAGAAGASGTPSVESQVPRDARVSGRVLDATGGPIAGAQVRALFAGTGSGRPRRMSLSPLAAPPDVTWSTDADGRFEGLAPTGGVMLVASAEAYTETWQPARAPVADVVLVLAPGARVSGRVQRSDGSPVVGASLQLRPRAMAMGRSPVEGTSDARGEFSLGGVPAGVVEVTASATGLSAAREWLHLSLAEVSAPIVLTLSAAHSVHGVVRTPEGTPCTTGLVQAGGRWQGLGEIDAQGLYHIDGLDDGAHELTAFCQGFGLQQQSLSVGADSPPSIELNWQLEPGFAVSGSVRHADGKPFEGALIWPYPVDAPDGAGSTPRPVMSGGSFGGTCNSDAAGEFNCGGLRAGWYQVRAGSFSGAGATSEPVRVDAQSRPRVELVVAAAGEVRVRVVSAAGSGVGGRFARGVFARGVEGMPIPAIERGDRFVFENLALGRYRVAIGRAASELGASAADVELTQPRQVIELELRAPEAMTIGGSVVDAAGEPLPDAWVEASLVEPGFPMPYDIAEPALTSSDGRFELGDLPPGTYAVRASHANGEAQLLDVSAGRRDVRLVVQGYGSLAGSVTGVDGQPARDFSVLAFSETEPGRPLSVDGQRGAWALPWITPGDYRIVIMASSGGASTNASVASGKETKVALRLDPSLAGEARFTAPKGKR